MGAFTAIQNVRTIDVTSSQSQEAQEVSRRFHEIDPKNLQIRIESSTGDVVVVPEALGNLLQTVLRLAASGQAIGITQLPKALTSVEAAKVLGISRPTLLKLAAKGEISSHKVGSHTRFNRSDLLAFAEQRLDNQHKSFDELRDLEDSMGFSE